MGGAEASVLLKLSPLPGAETWAEYVGPDGENVAPSITYFKNALGGRVAVLSQGLSGNRSSSIYSPRKQELFACLFDRLSQGRLDVCASETPCTWVLACVSENGGEMMVMVNNLAGETRDDVVLRLSEKWRGAEVAHLGMDGSWRPIGKADGRTWPSAVSFQFMCPEYFLFSVSQTSAVKSESVPFYDRLTLSSPENRPLDTRGGLWYRKRHSGYGALDPMGE